MIDPDFRIEVYRVRNEKLPELSATLKRNQDAVHYKAYITYVFPGDQTSIVLINIKGSYPSLK